MIVNSTRKQNQAFYTCGTRQRRKDGCTNKLMLHQRAVEGQIIEWIKGTLLDTTFLTDYFQRVIEASNALLKDSQSNVERLKRKIRSLDHQIDRLTDAVADGAIPYLHRENQDRCRTGREARSRSTNPPVRTPTPETPRHPTFQAELIQALDKPEMQKAAVSGLIKRSLSIRRRL